MSLLVKAEELKRFVTKIFIHVGMPKNDAAWIAETLTQAELRGTSSHGVIRIPDYMRRLETGAVNTNPVVTIEKDAGALALLDGDNGMGQVTSQKGMEDCIGRAKIHNVGIVVMKRSNHFGAAGNYTRLAVAQGCIGIAASNGRTERDPEKPIYSTVTASPLSLAVPTQDQPPLVLDMGSGILRFDAEQFVADKEPAQFV